MKLEAFDTETHRIEPGLLAPPLVCASWFDGETATLSADRDTIVIKFESLLDSDTIVAVANGAYDLAVMVVTEPRLLSKIYAKLERGEFWDILIMQALHDVAGGHLFKLPNGMPLRLPEGPVKNRYSLELVTYLLTGRTNAKENDTWRLRYGELDGIPVNEWPDEAIQYPKDDVRNTYEDAVIQIRDFDKERNGGDVRKLPGVTHLNFQTRAAFAMHLGAVRGLKIDREYALKLQTDVAAANANAEILIREMGLIRADGKLNRAELKRLIAIAYGADPTSRCIMCLGSKKIPSPKTGKPINCPMCDCTGLIVSEGVPKTEGDGICSDRDTLEEADHPVLNEYAQLSKIKKLYETYVPFVLQGLDAPINVSPNILVSTGRASYEGLIQLLPREGGVRECIVPREGYVLCSVDYAAVEMCTLAQVHLYMFGRSAIAEVINSTGKPGELHSAFAAKMANLDFNEFKAGLKVNPKFKSLRQMAKAANFGFPGFMGAAKLVIAKRKEKSKEMPDGLRFCVESGARKTCGETIIHRWNDRPIPPTCHDCIMAAQELRRAWLAQWPEMEDYFERVKNLTNVESGTAVIDSPGSGYRRGGLGVSDAANHSFQHLAAMGAKNALWLVSKEAYTDSTSPLYGSCPIIFAHDEIIAEIPIARQHDAAYRLAELCVQGMKVFVPDVAIQASPCIMKRWYKNAEEVFDNDARLIPWEPK